MAADGLTVLQERVRLFAQERDWGQFHTPKNLTMALAGEVGELIEHFQWLTPAESAAVMDDPATARAVADELADVLIYLVRLADVLGVDLLDAAGRKLADNATRYPADQARGSAAKAPRPEAPGGG
ncbi:MAG: nucleotide pyrophosphohydrolase [Acidimicrobiia bacterium]